MTGSVSKDRETPVIYVDADACPVKEEVYRVAKRYGLRVVLVANSWMRVPDEAAITLEVVDDGFDAADDWIVAQAEARDIVVTTDIPLAARCVEKAALALNPKGHVFTEENIGANLANREFLAQMREHGEMGGGPAPFTAQNRSAFLQQLDRLIHLARKRK